ncbi:hypothetical protein [Flagellimonas marinaquae]|nr:MULTISPECIES: hypothetical protein [Allomuricauda]USD25362.1 hypothetical protein MJO53_00330 [Allomuricauda aquimarina]
MNKRTLIFSTLLLVTMAMHAQGPIWERVKTLKVAFITERIDLTSEEAQQFWPVYNEHEETLERIRKKERFELFSNISNAQNLTNSESETLLDNIMALQQEKLKAEESFLLKMRKIIPAQKVLLLLKAEEDFKKQMIHQFRKRKGGGG